MDLYPHTYAALSAISQVVTKWPGHPLRAHSSVGELSKSVNRLRYRGDHVASFAESMMAQLPEPMRKIGEGVKFEFLRHVSQSQRHIDLLDSGSTEKFNAGDCDDFCAYIAGAIIASGLADDGSVRMVCLCYTPKNGTKPVAHMVAEWMQEGQPFCVSNWFECEAKAGTARSVMTNYLGVAMDPVYSWQIELCAGDVLRLTPTETR